MVLKRAKAIHLSWNRLGPRQLQNRLWRQVGKSDPVDPASCECAIASNIYIDMESRAPRPAGTCSNHQVPFRNRVQAARGDNQGLGGTNPSPREPYTLQEFQDYMTRLRTNGSTSSIASHDTATAFSELNSPQTSDPRSRTDEMDSKRNTRQNDNMQSHEAAQLSDAGRHRGTRSPKRHPPVAGYNSRSDRARSNSAGSIRKDEILNQLAEALRVERQRNALYAEELLAGEQKLDYLTQETAAVQQLYGDRMKRQEESMRALRLELEDTRRELEIARDLDADAAEPYLALLSLNPPSKAKSPIVQAFQPLAMRESHRPKENSLTESAASGFGTSSEPQTRWRLPRRRSESREVRVEEKVVTRGPTQLEAGVLTTESSNSPLRTSPPLRNGSRRLSTRIRPSASTNPLKEHSRSTVVESEDEPRPMCADTRLP